MKRFLLLFALILFFIGCGPTKSEFTVEQVPQVIAGNEIAAQARLRSIVTAEMSYSMESGGEYASLDTLVEKGMMADPSRGKLTGYHFNVRVTGRGFEATAEPERYGITGRRSFFVDDSRVIRGADKRGSSASASDPEIQ